MEGDSLMAPRKVKLSVNDVPIPIEGFTQEFIERVITGMLTVLKGTGETKVVHLSIKGDFVNINLNNAPVPVNPFVNKFIKNTVIGMVSSLKGVGQIDRLEVSITE